MLRYLDSFNTYNTAQIPRRWQAQNPTGGVPAIVAGGLYSTNCLRLAVATTTAPTCWVQISLDNQATWAVGFRLKINALPAASAAVAIVGLWDSLGLQCQLWLDSGGHLVVGRSAGSTVTGGTSSNALTTGTWNFIEWKVTISDSIPSGSCVVNVNGVQWLSAAAGQDMKALTVATANLIRVGLTGSGNMTANPIFDYGDFYICDSAAGDTGLVGDRKVVVRAPNGVGASSQFANSGTLGVNNYAYVNDAVSDDDAGYVQDGTTGDVDLYALADHGSDVSTIYAVQAVATWRKNAAGARSAKITVRDSGGVNHTGPAVGLADNYTQYTEIYTTDPGTGLAWTTANFDATQIGVTVGA